jgi:hypothetical protein
MRQELRPQGPAQRALASVITELAWCLQRAEEYEAALIRARRQRGKRE